MFVYLCLLKLDPNPWQINKDLYVIIVELEHNNKIYIKDATPFVTDCDEGIKRAENTFRRTPDIKLKSVKCKSFLKN